MKKIDPDLTSPLDMYQFMIGAISPRPIAFVSTIDTEGVPNLAPFSFFTGFSCKPPFVGFTCSVRANDGTNKDTLDNVREVGECVINMVSYNFVRQMTLTAVRYPKEVNEFEKAGLTPIKSDLVRPFRIKESPIHMECRVEQIIPFSEEKGGGILVVCRILRMHIAESVMDVAKNRIDPRKVDTVGRMGRFWYTRANGDALFEIQQPEQPMVIGYDALPQSIRSSEVLTANNVAEIAGLSEFPSEEAILAVKKDIRVQKTLFSQNILRGLHLLAQEEMNKGNKDFGIKVALLGDVIRKN
ncbi:MAG: flavin reductase family protein [Saprospiraceae bacterium]|nr:flavin reductase family protein [Saprospiraceae bacterium]